MPVDELYKQEQKEKYREAMLEHIEHGLNMMIVELFQSRAAASLHMSRKDIIITIRDVLETEFHPDYL